VTVFLAQLINGIAVGSIYGLIVTGFNLLLLVGGVIQFAYPNLVVLSMYVIWLVLDVTHGSLVLAIPAGILAAVAMNLLTEPLFRPLVKRGATNQTFVIAMALAMMVTYLMAKGLNHGVAVPFPQSLTGTGALWRVGIATVTIGQVVTIVGSFAAVLAFLYLLGRTRLGRSFRVMAQAPGVARLLGIPVIRTSMYSFGVAGLLAGATAVFLAMALGSAGPTLGDLLALKAIAIALFAGLGNLRGGLFGALILGVAESLIVAYVPGNWSSAIAFAMIMVVIMFKPKGLFGARV